MTSAALFAAALHAGTWDEYHRLITAAQEALIDERTEAAR